MSNKIKPKAICVFRNKEEILVSEYINPQTNEPFYRPLGGRIDFSENSAVTLQREIMEELGAEIQNIRFLGVIENIYHHKGKQSHELMFIYDADFVDPSFYLESIIEGYEYTDDRKFTVYWKPISEFLNGNLTLYPEGLLDLLIEDMLVELPIIKKEEQPVVSK
ncbi:MAG: NUDIX hydrolase [Asgard group archaeon]|nr:NUDIX hydrolase [Asgard group archaeon]